MHQVRKYIMHQVSFLVTPWYLLRSVKTNSQSRDQAHEGFKGSPGNANKNQGYELLVSFKVYETLSCAIIP